MHLIFFRTPDRTRFYQILVNVGCIYETYNQTSFWFHTTTKEPISYLFTTVFRFCEELTSDKTQRGFLYRTFRHLWFVYLLFKAVTVKQSTQVKVGVLKVGCVRNVTTRLQLALLWSSDTDTKKIMLLYVTNDVVMMKTYLYFPDLISQQITIICVWFGLKEGQNNRS
jgi:hypothetical protein